MTCRRVSPTRRIFVATHNHPETGPQTKALVGPHSLQTCGTSDPQSPQMRPHCLQTAHKQASETTLFTNSPRPLLINGFSPLDLVNDRVYGHRDRMEPTCPTSLSIGNCPKKDGSSPETETPGGLVMQGSASYDCP